MTLMNNEKALVKQIVTNTKKLCFELAENGGVFAIRHGDIMINQYLGNPVEGGVGNLYLRCFDGKRIESVALIGPESQSTYTIENTAVVWRGRFGDLEYACRLQLAKTELMWFWTVYLKNHGSSPISADVISVQDLGMATQKAIARNEAYVSQYIDQKPLTHKKCGVVLCSRQNTKRGMASQNPWLMHGCLEGSSGYLTDGFQFYGLEYKAANLPSALKKEKLEGKVLQYEFSLSAIQSGKIQVRAGAETSVTFFSVYVPDQPQATRPADITLADKAATVAAKTVKKQFDWSNAAGKPVAPTLLNHVQLFASRDLTASEMSRYFSGKKRSVEKSGRNVLSFFYGDHVHVVLRAKELLQDRPTGMIYRAGRDLKMADDILTTTVYACGMFNSQLAIGSSELNKLLSVSRNHLGVIKGCGQRIFMETAQGYQMLGLPSAMEMGLHHVRWFYAGKEETIVVTSLMDSGTPSCFLKIEVLGKKSRRFIITNNIVMGNNEWEDRGRIRIDVRQKTAEIRPDTQSLLGRKYPQTTYFMVSPDAGKIDRMGTDELLYADGKRRGHPYLVVRTQPVRCFTLALTGSVTSRKKAVKLAQRFGRAIPTKVRLLRDSKKYWNDFANSVHIRLSSDPALADSLNDILYWHMHTAMMGYLSPHGLEQNTSAQWGTRDVSQGPFELLECIRQYGSQRDLLKILISNQAIEDGNWAQGFRYDRYRAKDDDEDTHGDTVVWPMKIVSEYIMASNDLAFLNEKLPYWSKKKECFTTFTETVLDHIRRELAHMKSKCLPGTALIRYGFGDWEDTLQPADPSLRERMVSGWTVELLYQTLRSFQAVCYRAGQTRLVQEVSDFADQMKHDFHKYLVKDDVVAGLVLFEKGKPVEYMMHPRDRGYGIRCRLLPMTRGMTSGMFTPEEVTRHYAIIRKNLYYPDGVRLIEKPIGYDGGNRRYFQRAETAANFGREIGMLYVHAHLRFVEAMATIGKADEALRGLRVVNPIGVTDTVPSAHLRQANVYFSSSDADFANRYLACKNFDLVKKGRVKSKCGWRFFSSGPGVFLNLLLCHVFGLREQFGKIVIDPVMSKSLDGLVLDFNYGSRKVQYRYHVKSRECSPSILKINGVAVERKEYLYHPYRKGGIMIDQREFRRRLNHALNVVDISL